MVFVPMCHGVTVSEKFIITMMVVVVGGGGGDTLGWGEGAGISVYVCVWGGGRVMPSITP